jgi:ribosomal protein L44E
MTQPANPRLTGGPGGNVRPAAWHSGNVNEQDTRLVCVECGAEADEEAEGWRMLRADVPQQGDTEPELAAYCPDCAAREFA